MQFGNTRAIAVAFMLLAMALFFCSAPKLCAQSNAPKTVFKEVKHNFGIIAEDGGSVKHDFVFTNKGNSPLIVMRVTSDCGCTTPRVTQSAIEAGQDGVLTVEYDPQGRPGAFMKKVRVYTNAEVEPLIIEISGNVATRGGAEKGEFISLIGELQVSTKHLVFPTASQQRASNVRLVVNNNYKHPIDLELTSQSGLFTMSKKVLSLGVSEPSEVIFTSNIADTVKPGIYTTPVIVQLRDGNRTKPLRDTILVKLPVAPQLDYDTYDSVPKAQFDTYIDLGKAQQQATFESSISIKNVGAAPLELFDVYCNNPYVSFAIQNNKAKAGEDIVIRYKIDLATLRTTGDNLNENVELMMNDPHAPYRIVRLVLEIR